VDNRFDPERLTNSVLNFSAAKLVQHISDVHPHFAELAGTCPTQGRSSRSITEEQHMGFYDNPNELPRNPSAMERTYEGAGATMVAVTLVVAMALGFLFLFTVPNQRNDNQPTTTEAAPQPATQPTTTP
jgi:uncharacterized protein HemX